MTPSHKPSSGPSTGSPVLVQPPTGIDLWSAVEVSHHAALAPYSSARHKHCFSVLALICTRSSRMAGPGSWAVTPDHVAHLSKQWQAMPRPCGGS